MILASLKVGFVLFPLPLKELPAYWGEPFKVLLKTFQTVVVKILERKSQIQGDRKTNDEQKRQAYTELASNVDAYYDEVKGALVAAIAQLEEDPVAEDTSMQPMPCRTAALSSPPAESPAAVSKATSPSQTDAVLPSFKKRPSEGAEDDGKPHKRPRADIPKSSSSMTSSTARSEESSGGGSAEHTDSGST